ncbi:putative protein serine/threonine kinase [Tieghemostelium lacteum]|uniref:BUB1 N-terminal domain-containing protein n=1 Tax=Tieghemostelium lacteum TaxID=361077 RepID=A0A151Z8B6_TIELA|nr:putative protein serine/threonine kinase [Tieghemostelium lacteum]|eukprot:KYQ90213.1 putative protein serine/threonine kinase [Tieghemostelium lacteum]
MSVSDWENVKENILPLNSGRDPSKLASFGKASLSSSITTPTPELEIEKEKFENLIKEYKGDDPIDNWLKYTKWVQQSYPGGNMKNELIVLLERCTKLFLSWEKYKNDPRYLRIWITYADMCSDPVEIFSFLETNKIGCNLSLLYEARAIVYENKGNYQQADLAYQQGIQRKAQPLERLQQKHSDFERRLISRMKHQQQQGLQPQQQTPSQDQQSENKVSRSALGTISSSTVGSERKSLAQPTKPSSTMTNDDNQKKRKVPSKSSNSEFMIFDDSLGSSQNVETNSKFLGSAAKKTGGSGSVVVWDELEPELHKHKENTQIAQKWTDSKVPQKKVKSQGNEFQVYCDDPQSLQSSTSSTFNKPMSPNKLQQVSQSSLSRYEQIQNNPLANFPKQPLSTTSTSSSSQRNEKIGYKKALFMINETEELSFEQLRANKHKSQQILRDQEQRRQRELELEMEKQKLQKEMQVEKEKETLKELELQKQKQQQLQQLQQQQQKLNIQMNRPPSPTMTIHTKEAFNDVMAMFNEPLQFESIGPKSFSQSTLDSPFGASTKQPVVMVPTTITSNNIDENDEYYENQENLDPMELMKKRSILTSSQSKVTNRDIIQKQMFNGSPVPPQPHQQQDEEFLTIDDRERIETIDRIDRYVKKEIPTFEIFEDPSLASKTNNSNTNSTDVQMMDKSILGNSISAAANGSTGKGGFTIYEEPNQNFLANSVSSLSISSMSTTPDPTTVIFLSLTPENGILNPYDMEHLYLLEQYVSGNVELYPGFVNVSDDDSQMSKSISEQGEILQKSTTLFSQPQPIGMNLLQCIYSNKSAVGSIQEFNIERTDDLYLQTAEGSSSAWQVMKLQDPPSIWEFYISSQIKQKMASDQLLHYNDIKSLFYFSDRSIMLTDYLENGSIYDLVQSKFPVEESLALYNTIEILKVVDGLHQVGIINGSLSPRSFYFIYGDTSYSDWTSKCNDEWKKKGFRLTNYYRAIDISLYSDGVKFQSQAEHLAEDCSDPLWLKSREYYSYDLDYLGICKVVFYYLSSGKSIALAIRDNQELVVSNLSELPSAYQSNPIWNQLFTKLLNHKCINNSSNVNILKEVQATFESYLESDSRSKFLKNLSRKQKIHVFQFLKSISSS